jgi:hypothetical protein
MGDRKVPARAASYDKKAALVLQGGGALGSYQAGVYEALSRVAMACPMPPEVGARTFDVLKDVPRNAAPGTVETGGFSKSAV